MLGHLTQKHETLLSTVRDKWIGRALASTKRLSRTEVTPHVNWLYGLANLASPIVVCVDSPLAAQYAANILATDVGSQVRAQVRAQVWAQVRDQVSDQVSDQVWAQVSDQVRDQVSDQVSDQVRDQVWAQVSDQVSDQVRDQVWAQVRDQVWAQVWAQVRAQVRAQVGDQVWAQVSDQVSDQVSAQVRAQVWAQVSDQVSDQDLNSFSWGYCGLAYESGWTSFYHFFRQIGIVNSELFDRWLAFLDCGVWECILFRGFAILCATPKSVVFDRDDLPWGQRRLHCLDGPAVEWHDGARNHFVAGVSIDGALVDDPKTITKERILSERNAEVRKALIQIVGLPAFLEMTEAITLDEDTDASGMPRRLLSIDSGTSTRWCVVEVECPSKRDKHYLWVPPGMTRCSQAVAWTYGFEAEEYRPLVEA